MRDGRESRHDHISMVWHKSTYFLSYESFVFIKELRRGIFQLGRVLQLIIADFIERGRSVV